LTQANTTPQARALRHGFDRVGDRAGKFAAQAKPLHQPKGEQQQRRGSAALRIGRQEPHCQRNDGDDQHRAYEHDPPSYAVTEVAEDDAADRPREVTDGKTRVGKHLRDQGVGRWEECRTDRRSEHAEHHEIVEFQRATEASEQDHAPR
jgi:hypothetical protein